MENKNVKIYEKDLCKIIDFSMLHNTDTKEDICAFVNDAKEGGYGCVFTMPYYVAMVKKLLVDSPEIHTGAPVGFPTGAEPIDVKKMMTEYHVNTGVDEIDFVINIGALKSRDFDVVKREVEEIVGVSKNRVVKGIIEVSCLTDDEIYYASKIVYEGGANFVKTGTGFMPTPTSLHHIELIKDSIGNKISIKAAGGIRNIETVKAMMKLGVTRFGIGNTSALEIVKQFKLLYPSGMEI